MIFLAHEVSSAMRGPIRWGIFLFGASRGLLVPRGFKGSCAMRHLLGLFYWECAVTPAAKPEAYYNYIHIKVNLTYIAIFPIHITSHEGFALSNTLLKKAPEPRVPVTHGDGWPI